MEKTAVEWLVEQLKINNYISENSHWLIDDAKEMEKRQIINAWGESRSGLEYYNRVYKKE